MPFLDTEEENDVNFVPIMQDFCFTHTYTHYHTHTHISILSYLSIQLVVVSEKQKYSSNKMNADK